MKLLILLLLFAVPLSPMLPAQPRSVINLSGTWEIAEGSMQRIPQRFTRAVPVPGLADMAVPRFESVGVRGEQDSLREAFWYRRTFVLHGRIPDVARLKVSKAMYGTRVFVNGRLAGEHMPSFTPGYFNIRPFLRGEGATNQIVIRVGASRSAIPGIYMDGQDYEKTRYIPGIYDAVKLITSGSPYIIRVQAAPDSAVGSVTVESVIGESGGTGSARVQIRIREGTSGTLIAERVLPQVRLKPKGETVVRERIPISAPHLWTPEDPFLYVLEVRAGSDTTSVRFGMRSFRFDPASGVALLNERPYYLRGTNVCILRFFEDPQRGALPWDERWVRTVIRAFKDMHWNSARYCIGFPPEIWYRIADEEGLLIQDEAPNWLGPTQNQRREMTPAGLAQEFTEWMQERWNHPSVVIWDAQNESADWPLTGEVIRRVRGLDLSNRPWENGWSPRQDRSDPVESHTYYFVRPRFRLSRLARETGEGDVDSALLGSRRGAVLLNEYGWYWIDRGGMPTTLAVQARSFERIHPGILRWTPDLYRETYARTMALETEFFRGRRKLSGVLHFCGLGYSRPGGQTSDNFIDIRQGIFEPHFYQYVREAFAPVGVMIDFWGDRLRRGSHEKIPVHVVNDTYEDWKGPVKLRVMKGERAIVEQSRDLLVPALGQGGVEFTVPFPADSGNYTLVAGISGAGGEEVHSVRDVATGESADSGVRPLPVKVTASSFEGTHGPELAADGDDETRWSSRFSDPQWIMLDLGAPLRVGRVVLDWENACGKSYSIESSLDGEKWTENYRTDDGKGGVEELTLTPVTARYVRMFGRTRATEWGYSLYAFEAFPP
jgi:beta-galactosidase